MLKYIVKRILIFLPTLFAISLLTFIIVSNAPGDPAESMLNRATGGDGGQASDMLATDKAYRELRSRLGLDLPIFYISFSNLSATDTLHRIAKKDHRNTLDRLNYEYGNWQEVEKYYVAVKNFEMAILNVKKDSLTAAPLITLRNTVNNLYINYKDAVVKSAFSEMKKSLNATEALNLLNADYDKMISAYESMKTNTAAWKKFIPVLHFNGVHNQYHRWLFGEAKWFVEDRPDKSRGFIRGDFGISFFSKRPVSTMIWEALGITMLISFLSIIITYLISIPIGIFSALKKDTPVDQGLTTFLFILYSLPGFWIATLLIFFLGGGDYLDIFPPAGLGDTTPDDPLFERLSDLGYHLILPLFCYTYGSFAYLSRQMRGGMLAVLGQDYIRTARAKGLENKAVVWKHAFRNSLLPIITIFASVFPALIGGSVVLEYIFTIPGLGRLGFSAVIQRDYPVILTVTMFSAILTLVGYLVADILYALADPRISYTKKA